MRLAHNGTRNTPTCQHNGVRRLPVLRLPNGAHNPGVRLSNGTHSPPPLLSPRRAKEELKEEYRKPSLSLASDKANSPTWSITKVSHLDEEEAETRSSISEKVLGETYKPLEEMEWPTCFPAPPSSPSNSTSSPSRDFLHEISPSPPPDFKHETSPSPPPDFRHDASTLPLSDRRYKNSLLPLPHTDLHQGSSSPISPLSIQPHTSPSPPPDFRCDTSPTLHPNTPVPSPECRKSPSSPPPHLINTLPLVGSRDRKSPSPPPECRWLYINDLQLHSSASSSAGSAVSPSQRSRRQSSSSVGHHGAITLSPAKLQYEDHYSPPGAPPSAPSPNLGPSPSPPHDQHSSSSSASTTSQHDLSLSFLCNASPSPPLPNFPNVESPESPTHYDMPGSDLSEHSQKSKLSESEEPPLQGPLSPASSPPAAEVGGSQGEAPTPPPVPTFFDDDENPPTPPPIPVFFDAESPPLSPPMKHLGSPVEIQQEILYQPIIPRSEVYSLHGIKPALDVIQESPPPDSQADSQNDSPTPEPPFDIRHKSPPPDPPFDIVHPSSPEPASEPKTSPSGDPCTTTEKSAEPQTSGVERKSPSPAPASPPPARRESPPSLEYFSLPDNWPSYPPFLFGDSDFPPP